MNDDFNTQSLKQETVKRFQNTYEMWPHSERRFWNKMKRFAYIAIIMFIMFVMGYIFGLYAAAYKVEHGPLLDNVRALKRAAHELRNPFTKELK